MDNLTKFNKIGIIENITKSITLLTGFLIFIGSLYFHFYYEIFNINIFRYIDISEIVVSFLNILIPVSIFLIFITGYIYCVHLVGNLKKNNAKKVDEVIQKKESFWTITTIQSIWNIVTISICIILLLIMPSSLPFTITFSNIIENEIIQIILILTTIILGIIEYNIKYIIINFLSFSIMIAGYNAIDDVNNKLRTAKSTTFSFYCNDGDTITTNENIIFVGRTSKYIFLYNLNDKSNVYLSTSEIKKYNTNKIKQ